MIYPSSVEVFEQLPKTNSVTYRKPEPGTDVQDVENGSSIIRHNLCGLQIEPDKAVRLLLEKPDGSSAAEAKPSMQLNGATFKEVDIKDPQRYIIGTDTTPPITNLRSSNDHTNIHDVPSDALIHEIDDPKECFFRVSLTKANKKIVIEWRPLGQGDNVRTDIPGFKDGKWVADVKKFMNTVRKKDKNAEGNNAWMYDFMFSNNAAANNALGSNANLSAPELTKEEKEKEKRRLAQAKIAAKAQKRRESSGSSGSATGSNSLISTFGTTKFENFDTSKPTTGGGYRSSSGTPAGWVPESKPANGSNGAASQFNKLGGGVTNPLMAPARPATGGSGIQGKFQASKYQQNASRRNSGVRAICGYDS
jgi:hypothetical protein